MAPSPIPHIGDSQPGGHEVAGPEGGRVSQRQRRAGCVGRVGVGVGVGVGLDVEEEQAEGAAEQRVLLPLLPRGGLIVVPGGSGEEKAHL